MEAVNGDFDKDGPPPPSPLTGCYLLIVVGEPHSGDHKDIILQRIAKGLLSWNVNDCMVDLEKELELISEQALEGEEARHGERLIQFASENLVTEILIHPVVSTLVQCMRNLLSSFTRHRHIIHAGYTFAANGSWALQDGTFSYADFAEAFLEIETQRVIHAYENGISLHLHCSPEGDWCRLPKESFTKGCNVRVNPTDVLTCGSPSITGFINYISQFLIPMSLENLLQCSDVVGNIRFSRPTLYVFPGGQGDAALFGVNGFNMLLDGGFSRKACFWDFVRHLDRLDAVLMTRLNNSNIGGISSILRRKRKDAVYPHLGHFFCNIQDRKTILSPDGDKDRDPLLIDLLNEGQEIISNLHHLNLNPQTCYRDPEPINLYHKVGHGTLNMYVLNPAKDSKEVKEFIQKWNQCDQKLFSKQQSTKFSFPIQNLISIAVLLIWQPANVSDTITRILYPGSSPQQKIFEGLERLKNIEFVRHPVCSEKSLFSKFVAKKSAKQDEKVILKDKPAEKKEKLLDNNINAFGGGEAKERNVKKSDSVESERVRSKKIEENKIITENNEKLKMRTKKIKVKQESQPRKKSAEKTDSPTTPKKSIDQEAPKKQTSTPAKSTKDANNRKVIENKAKSLKSAEPKAKLDKKPISKKPRTLPKTPISPAKRVMNGLQKIDSISDRQKAKLEKDGTTDSSTVSTPTADQDSLKKDISNLSTEQIQQLKAQELADLEEEQEAIKEIEAVFRKGETRANGDENMRKVKSISIDEDKSEKEEYLIIEREDVVTDFVDEKEKKEIDLQKLTRDSEESEKQRNLITEEDQKSIKEAKDVIKARESAPVTKDVVVTSQEEKVEIPSSEKKSDKEAEVKDIPESQPDEKMSANIKSGDTTTAPTLPEDERIPLDEIKEDNGYPIEEKYVREETKEKGLPIIQLPTKTFDSIPKTPGVVGIRLDKQSHIRDIVKTPDEVADLPVHEEVDYEYAHESKTDLKINEATTENVKSNGEEIRESKDEEKEVMEQSPVKEIYEKADKEVMETKAMLEPKEQAQEIEIKPTDLDIDKSQKRVEGKQEEEKYITDIVKTGAAGELKQVLPIEEENIMKTDQIEQVDEDRKKSDEMLKEPHEEFEIQHSTQENKDEITTGTEIQPKESVTGDKLIKDVDDSVTKESKEDIIETLSEQRTEMKEKLHEVIERSATPEQIKKKDFEIEEICKSSEEEKVTEKGALETLSVKSGETELSREQAEQDQIDEKPLEMKDKASLPQQIEKEDSKIKQISEFKEETKDSDKITTEISSVKLEKIETKEHTERFEESDDKPSITFGKIEEIDSKTKDVPGSEEEKRDSDKVTAEIPSIESGKVELDKEHIGQYKIVEEKSLEMKDEMEKKDLSIKDISKTEEEQKAHDESVETSLIKPEETQHIEKHTKDHEETEKKPLEIIEKSVAEQTEKKDSKEHMEEAHKITEKSEQTELSKEHTEKLQEKPHVITDKSISGQKESDYELEKMSEPEKLEKIELGKEKIDEKAHESTDKSSIFEKTEKKDSKLEEFHKPKESEQSELSKEHTEDLEEKPHEIIDKSISEPKENEEFKLEEGSKPDKLQAELSKEHTEKVEEKTHETAEKSCVSEQIESEDFKLEEVHKSEKIEQIELSKEHTEKIEEKAHEIAKKSSISEQMESEDFKLEKIHEPEVEQTGLSKKHSERSEEEQQEIMEKPSTCEEMGTKDSKLEDITKPEKPDKLEEGSKPDKLQVELSKEHTEKVEEKTHETAEKSCVSEQIESEDFKLEEVHKSEKIEQIELSKEHTEKIEEKAHEIAKKSSISEQTESEDFKLEKIHEPEVEQIGLSRKHSERLEEEQQEIMEKPSTCEEMGTKDSKLEDITKPEKPEQLELSKDYTETIEVKAHEIKEKLSVSEQPIKEDTKLEGDDKIEKGERKSNIEIPSFISEASEIAKHTEQKQHEIEDIRSISEQIKLEEAKVVPKSEEETGFDKNIVESLSLKSGQADLTKDRAQQYEKVDEKSSRIDEKSSTLEETKPGDILKYETERKESDEIITSSLKSEHSDFTQDEIKEASISEKVETKDSKIEQISKSEKEQKDDDKSTVKSSPVKSDETSVTKKHHEELEEKSGDMKDEFSITDHIKEKGSVIEEVREIKEEKKGSEKSTPETSSIITGKIELTKEQQYEAVEDETKHEKIGDRKDVEKNELFKEEDKDIKKHTEDYEKLEQKLHEEIKKGDSKIEEVSKSEKEKKGSDISSPETSFLELDSKFELIKEHAEQREQRRDSLSHQIDKDDFKVKDISKLEEKKDSDKSTDETTKSAKIDLTKEHIQKHEEMQKFSMPQQIAKEDFKVEDISKFEEKKDSEKSTVDTTISAKTDLSKERVDKYDEIEKSSMPLQTEKEDFKTEDISKLEEKKDSGKVIAEISLVKSEKDELIKGHTERYEEVDDKSSMPEQIREEDFKVEDISKFDEKKYSVPLATGAELALGPSEKSKDTEKGEEIKDECYDLEKEPVLSEKMGKEDSKIKDNEEKCDKSIVSLVKSEPTGLAKEYTEKDEKAKDKEPFIFEKVDKEDDKMKEDFKVEEKIVSVTQTSPVKSEEIEKYKKIDDKPHEMKEEQIKEQEHVTKEPPKFEEGKTDEKGIVEGSLTKSKEPVSTKEDTEESEAMEKKSYEITEKSSISKEREINDEAENVSKFEADKQHVDKSSTEISLEPVKKDLLQHQEIEDKVLDSKDTISTTEHIEKKDSKMKEISKFDDEKKDSDKTNIEDLLKSKENDFTEEHTEKYKGEKKEESAVLEQIKKEEFTTEASNIEKEKMSDIMQTEMKEKPHEKKTTTSEQTNKDFELEHSKEISKFEDDKIQQEVVKSELLDKKPPTEQVEVDLKTQQERYSHDTKEEETEKVEIVRKLPKDREEDVIKIVATVAEVLKSDAPLEEFKDKLPISFDTCKTPYVTELRETHITTTELPDETDILSISEESSAISLHEEADEIAKKSLAATLIPSKILPEDVEEALEEEMYDTEEQGIVQRMLVTASSEDGGEEIEICPVGTIIFSKSSESSGRSSPEKSQESKKSSIVDTISDSLTTVKQYTEAELEADIGHVDSEQDLISDDRTKDKEEVTPLEGTASQKTDTSKHLEEKTEDESQKSITDIQKERDEKETQSSKDIKSSHIDEKQKEAAHITDLPDVCSKIVNGKETIIDDIKTETHIEKDILASSMEDIKDGSKSEVKIKDSVTETATDKKIEAKSDTFDFKDDTTKNELKSTETVTDTAHADIHKDAADADVHKERKLSTSDISTTVVGIKGDTIPPEKLLETKSKDYIDADKSVIKDKNIISGSHIPLEKSLDKKTEDHVNAMELIHEDRKTASTSDLRDTVSFKDDSPVKSLDKKTEDYADVNGLCYEDTKPFSDLDDTVTFKDVLPEMSVDKKTDIHKDAEEPIHEVKKTTFTSDVADTVAIKDVPPEKLDKCGDHADVNGLIEYKKTACTSDKTDASTVKDISLEKSLVKLVHEDETVTSTSDMPFKDSPIHPEKLSDLSTKSAVKTDMPKSVDEDKKIDVSHTETKSELELVKETAVHAGAERLEYEIKEAGSTVDPSLTVDFKGDKVKPDLKGIHKTESSLEVDKSDDKESISTDVSSDQESKDGKESIEDKHVIEGETTSLLDKSEKKGSSSKLEIKSGSEEIKQSDLESDTLNKKQIGLQKDIDKEDLKHDSIDFKGEDRKDLSESLTSLQSKGSATPPTAPMSSSESETCSAEKKDEREKEKRESLVSELTRTLDTDTFFEDSVLKDKKLCKETDLMCESFYGTLPGDESTEEEETQLESSHLYDLTNAKYLSQFSVSETDKADGVDDKKSDIQISKTTDTCSGKTEKSSTDTGECWDSKLETGASSLYLYEITKAKESLRSTVDNESEKKADTFALWGKPLGLPSPAPMTDNKGTPKKERKLPLNITVKNKWNDDKKRSESPSKTKNKKLSPIYVDLTYVPHHGNSYYSYVDFFKLVRARYYVFSGTEPGREVYNALLEAKQTWDDKELEVTIIPTYDTDVLGYWVAENEELLTKWKIDLSPSASRCTINLQDHETSCSAYRLEF